jgi:hypothetical protein
VVVPRQGRVRSRIGLLSGLNHSLRRSASTLHEKSGVTAAPVTKSSVETNCIGDDESSPCRLSMPHLADPSGSRHERSFGNDPGGLVPTGSWTDGP